MIDRLYELGEVDAHFKQKVLSRSNNIRFSDNILFPHETHSQKLVVSVGITKSANTNQAHFIFLLAVPTSLSPSNSFLVGIYNELLSLSLKDKCIDELLMCTTYNEFAKVLIKHNIAKNL